MTSLSEVKRLYLEYYELVINTILNHECAVTKYFTLDNKEIIRLRYEAQERNRQFLEYIKKMTALVGTNIPLLHAESGKPITSCRDVEDLMKGEDRFYLTGITDTRKVDATIYFALQHNQNLKQILETPASQAGPGEGKATRQRRNSIPLMIQNKDVELTRIEALLLKAYQTAGKKKITHITQEVIIKEVWPDAIFFGGSIRKPTKDCLKNHWSNLKKKLTKKKITLSDFRLKDIDGVKNYQLDKPPTWLKNIHFPKTLTPIRG